MENEETAFCPECQTAETEEAGMGKAVFCPFCGRMVRCVRTQRILTGPVCGREHAFCIPIALCPECGEELNPPGLLEEAGRELERQYREAVEQENGLSQDGLSGT